MSVHRILPWIAAAGFLAFMLLVAVRLGEAPRTAPKNIWLFPAALSGLFLAFFLYAVFTGSILGFCTCGSAPGACEPIPAAGNNATKGQAPARCP